MVKLNGSMKLRLNGSMKTYPLQYSGLEKSMDCIVHEVAKSWTQLSKFYAQTHSLMKTHKNF